MDVLRRVAMVDVALTLPFALPIVVRRVLLGFVDMERALGFTTINLPLDPHTVLFANVMGVIAVVWNVARVRAAAPDLARLDVPARGAVATVLAGYVLFTRVTPLLLAFVVTEIAGAVIQWRALRHAPRER